MTSNSITKKTASFHRRIISLLFEKPKVVINERDEWLLRLLQIGPFNLDQIMRASLGSSEPFFAKDKLARRLRKLDRAKYVAIRKWDLRLPGTLNYYKSTKKGREQVTTEPGRQSLFKKVAHTDQRHAFEVANVQAATFEHVRKAGLRIVDYKGDRQHERKVPKRDDLKSMKADSYLWVETPDQLLEFWDEVDLHTESIGGMATDSLEQKVIFHVARRQAMPDDAYVVRMFFKTSGLRMQRFMDLVADHYQSDETLFLATTIQQYCTDPSPLTNTIFVDHKGRARRLYKKTKAPRRQPALPIEELKETVAEPVLV